MCLLGRKVLRNGLKVFSKDGVVTNKHFWSIIKSFLTKKGHINREEVILRIEKITDSSVLAEMFNPFYISIVKKTSWKKPSHFARENNVSDTTQATALIDQSYLDHSSIKRIKTMTKNQIPSLQLLAMFVGQIQKKYLNIWVYLTQKMLLVFDMIPPKLAKMAASALRQALSNTMNNRLSNGILPENAKITMVSRLDKGTSKKNDISIFRPVSILTTSSKIYEKVTTKMIDKAMNKYLSPFISAYGQNYSTQNVLIHLLEEWREALDNNFIVGSVFMDLSKAFDYFPHDLLIAKLEAYGFDDYLVHTHI